jgi:hypothetical protein
MRRGLRTRRGAWLYPAQRDGWRLVAPEKLGSWLLLAIISFVLVTLVQRPAAPEAELAAELAPLAPEEQGGELTSAEIGLS